MNLQRLLFLMPLFVFVVLAIFFVRRLSMIEHGDMPEQLPSAMIDREAPAFTLATLDGKKRVTLSDLKGRATVINFFATWCVPCRAEHPLLQNIKDASINLVGISYKDDPDKVRDWLAKLGNPYDNVGIDKDGHVGIDFGVYGLPETYVLDRNGVIRLKQAGALSSEDIDQRIIPLARELSK